MKTILLGTSIFFIFLNSVLYSQNDKYNKELPLLEIKNKQFESILNNIIINLGKCNDLNEKDVFKIAFIENNPKTYVTITKKYDQKVILIDKYCTPEGYFILKNHSFFVFCDLNKNIFNISKTKKVFVFNHDTDPPIAIEEDPVWYYLIENDNFILEKVINLCDL